MFLNISLFFCAAFFEIVGCYAFWLYFRLFKTPLWLIVATVSLGFFAFILTKIDFENTARIYAVYGGIYIISSFLWMIFIEKELPNRWDLIGLFFVLIGACSIYFGEKFC